MNAVSLPGSPSPLHLTPTSNHPISNHSRGSPAAHWLLRRRSGCSCSIPFRNGLASRASPFARRLADLCNRIEFNIACVYGLVVRFQLLPTSPLSDAVAFSYEGSAPPPIGTFTQLLACAHGRTSTPVPGCSARPPRRAQVSVGLTADGGARHYPCQDHDGQCPILGAKSLFGGDAEQSHPGFA